MDTNSTNLTLCKEQEYVKVKNITGSGSFRKRLLEMGIIKGEIMYIVKYAPLKDPMEILLKGFHLTLRVCEAEQIIVEKIIVKTSSTRPTPV